MVGIYKITSPSGKIYVGQSIDIESRFNRYKRTDCKQQSKLWRSFLKYGTDNHNFEIIWLCNSFELNCFERKFQLKFDSIGEKGLNLVITKDDDRSGYLSNETKKKLSMSRKGKPSNRKGVVLSEETKRKMSVSQKEKLRKQKETSS
jgi:group I intron endonuclease